MLTQLDLVEKLALQPHPEGVFYRETYRSSLQLPVESLPQNFGGSRNGCTSIYYLLPARAFSAFHKIKSDEGWHFYEGLPLHVFVLLPNGNLRIIKLGRDLINGETYQAVVPANCWFASRPVGVDGFSLVGCTVAPGFDFVDFEMANRSSLLQRYPQHEQLILELTR